MGPSPFILEAMIPFFFFSCLAELCTISTSVYHTNAEQKFMKAWKFFENSNFSVNKSHFLFTAIVADLDIEQLSQELKVVGGVKGLLQNENALHCFILCAPVLDSVDKDFPKRNNLKKE